MLIVPSFPKTRTMLTIVGRAKALRHGKIIIASVLRLSPSDCRLSPFDYFITELPFNRILTPA